MRDRLIELIGSKVCEAYSPTCDEWQPHSCEKCFANSCRIGDLADHLLANGVIVPPCKVGDVVYTNISGTTLHNSFMINHIDLLGFSNGLYSWTWHQLGKSVFLSIEEAEKALEDRKNGRN